MPYKAVIFRSGNNPPAREFIPFHRDSSRNETCLQVPHTYFERRAKKCRISQIMRSVSIRITYIKDRDFSSRRLESIPAVTPSSGPSPRHPERRSGDVLFDGVSKREILTEQLSPAGIMWADGRREIRLPWNFRRTRYCSERERRGSETRAMRERERESERERRMEGGGTNDGSHRESTGQTSPFRIPWYPGDTGRA